MTSPAVSNLFNRGKSAASVREEERSDDPAVVTMNWRMQLIVGLCVLAYLFLGGVIFYYLERPKETSSHDEIATSYNQFLAHNPSVDSKNLSALLNQVGKAFASGFSLDENGTLIAPPSKWDYPGCVFFCMTVITTIGYGNLAPATSLGQSICCLYALFGIPLLAVFLSGIADRVKSLQVRMHSLACWRGRGRLPVIATSLLYGLFGLVIFFLVPAAVFTNTEGWSFGVGMYYSMVTLSTIGFGDYVAGQAYPSEVYRLSLACWIFIGMVYVSGLIHAVQVCMERSAHAVNITSAALHPHANHEATTTVTTGSPVKTEGAGNGFDNQGVQDDTRNETGACIFCESESGPSKSSQQLQVQERH